VIRARAAGGLRLARPPTRTHFAGARLRRRLSATGAGSNGDGRLLPAGPALLGGFARQALSLLFGVLR
jgi:hypothetical protein